MNFSHCGNDKIEQFRCLIEKSDRIVVVGHTNPDGDAMGSVLGMYHALKKQGKEVSMLMPDTFPEYYGFLPSSGEIIIAENDLQKTSDILDSADLLILQDLNQISRTGCAAEMIGHNCKPSVLIDHHLHPDTESFNLVFSEPGISSASELVFWILAQAYGKEIFDMDTATCLYTGICTDTGSFAYSCNHKSVYLAVAELVETGINIKSIHDSIFNTYSIGRMKFLGHCLNNCLHIMDDVPAAYFVASHADQKRFDLKDGDMEGIVNYALMMGKMEIGIILKETAEGVVRISFRSKHDFDVNSFARKYFNGGGHLNASGATSAYGMEETETLLVKHLREEYKNFKK